jgi:hypothetical protein
MPNFDWQTCDNDAAWRSAQQVMPAMATPHPGKGRRPAWAMRHWRLSVALLLILITSGGWAWHAAQQGIAQTEIELRDSIEADLWISTMVDQDEIEAELHAAMAAGEVVIGTKIRDLGEDWALVDVRLLPSRDGPVYRQTRVYDDRNGSWVRAAVAAEHWGRVRQLESRYFVFRYRSVDHEVIMQVTAQLDDLYAALYPSYFADAPAGEKLVVVLDPDGMVGKGVAQSSPQAATIVPSPSAVLAPAELPLDALLLQSVMLALFDKVADSARDAYKLSPQWLPLRNGLRLWFIWEQKLPLAVWRESLVQWTLGDLDKAAQVPVIAHDLCVHHQLWMRSPLEVGVPIQCLQTAAGERMIAWRYRYPPQVLALPSLADVQFRLEEPNTNLMKQPPESAASGVAWATVLDYATTTFGVEKLPVLLAALSEHERWETLVPAVFGMPLAEFESGWQLFLKAQYDSMP